MKNGRGVRERRVVKDELRSLGLRATGPRVAVLGLLREAEKPLSHGEVVELLDSEEWDRATVYRNLIKLTEAGLTRVTSHAGGVTRYEASRGDRKEHLHAHFACTTCGQVTCLADSRLELEVDLGWQRAIESAEVQVVGVCPGCERPNPRTKKSETTAKPTPAKTGASKAGAQKAGTASKSRPVQAGSR